MCLLLAALNTSRKMMDIKDTLYGVYLLGKIAIWARNCSCLDSLTEHCVDWTCRTHKKMITELARTFLIKQPCRSYIVNGHQVTQTRQIYIVNGHQVTQTRQIYIVNGHQVTQTRQIFFIRFPIKSYDFMKTKEQIDHYYHSGIQGSIS
ncbi:hypothetical protein STEG23_020644 [Scotinomys teguina]